MSNENEFKQETDRFIKGLENKLTDVVILASWATMENNARRDKKCKGLKRSASSKCCTYCMSHEGTYTSQQVDAGAMGGRHEACKCKVMPVFEVQTKEQKEAAKEARRLLEEAKKYEELTTILLKSLEKDGVFLEGLEYRLKSKESLERKILKDAREKKIEIKIAALNINDVLRYTFILDEDAFYESYKAISIVLAQEGYNYKQIKNTLKLKNVRYRGINALIEIRGNYVFELQFHTKKSFKVKQITHPMYEEFRQIGILKKRKDELEKEITEISNQIPMPRGVEKI